MKTIAKFSLLALGLAVAALPALTAAPTKAEPGARHALRAKVERRAALKREVARRLDLSADQKAELKAKRAETHAALKALRADTSLTREQKKEKARELLQSARSDLRAKLTPEQSAKLDRARERAGHRRKARGN
jgi:Skp family chaperone for outer membrane proteins